MENVTRNEKFEEALYRLNLMGVSDEFIIEPFKNGILRLSEYQNSIFNAIIFDVKQYKELDEYVKEFEENKNVLVYHVQLTRFTFGSCYSLFYVSDNKEDWEMDREDLKNGFAFVYVWNKTDPFSSEFGSIGYRSSLGGVVRTA